MLDFLGERKPVCKPIARIATLAEKEKLTLIVSPVSFATVNYFLVKFENQKVARETLRKFKIVSRNMVFKPLHNRKRAQFFKKRF